MNKVINLNKDDFQSKTILDPNGIANSLYSGESRFGGGEIYILDYRDKEDEQSNNIF